VTSDPYDPEDRAAIWQREQDERIATDYIAASYPIHEECFDLMPYAVGQVVDRRYAHQFLGDFPVGLLNQKASVDVVPTRFGEYLRAELRATMLGKKLPPHTVTESRDFHVDVFDTPWQHFKANHSESWWLGWLVRRRPVRTRRVTHTATLVATWDQFVGFPWQTAVSHLDRHAYMFGPAVRFASMHRTMTMGPAT